MAINAATYDADVRDWVEFLVANYPAAYSARLQIPPMGGPVELSEDVDELYVRAFAELDEIGERFGVPWDTQLDPESNTRMQQELTLLAQGDTSVDEFIETVDAIIQENGPQIFDDAG
jgi:raffinose/stachyose/melibiose transport system substrate-binding protein